VQTEFEYYCDDSLLTEVWGSEAVQQNLDRVFLRSNHLGYHQEIWQHTHGCRGWLRVLRHNLTHEIKESQPLGSNPVVDKDGRMQS
jgi:sarcosine oxidase subunit delta